MYYQGSTGTYSHCLMGRLRDRARQSAWRTGEGEEPRKHLDTTTL